MNQNGIPVENYLHVRAQLFALGYGHEWEWSQNVKPPTTAEQFAADAIWVTCCSGFREQAARITQAKVWENLDVGGSATTVFPKSGKGRAIDQLWYGRQAYFDDFRMLIDEQASVERLLGFVSTLPYVGGRILKYHFAKNMGVDCAKPDRWLCRLAGVPEEGDVDKSLAAVMELCRPLSAATGDRIATVDLILWRACNLGISITDLKEDSMSTQNKKPAATLAVTSIRAVDFEIACPHCGDIASAWIVDPRGRSEICDTCNKPYTIPADANVRFG